MSGALRGRLDDNDDVPEVEAFEDKSPMTFFFSVTKLISALARAKMIVYIKDSNYDRKIVFYNQTLNMNSIKLSMNLNRNQRETAH